MFFCLLCLQSPEMATPDFGEEKAIPEEWRWVHGKVLTDSWLSSAGGVKPQNVLLHAAMAILKWSSQKDSVPCCKSVYIWSPPFLKPFKVQLYLKCFNATSFHSVKLFACCRWYYNTWPLGGREASKGLPWDENGERSRHRTPPT